METFYIINQISKINRGHWNLPWMCCILKFRSLKISLETLERSLHRGEKTEISRGASWDIWNSPLYMRINKIRTKFHFLTKIEINNNDSPCGLVLFCFVFYCLFTSRAIWKLFYRRWCFWVVLKIRNMGRLGSLKPTVPARSSINPIRMVQTRHNWRQFMTLLAKSPLSSFSTGPRCKNIVRGASHVEGLNPGDWFEHVL